MNFIPEEKLSKKARIARAKAKRGTWGAVNPVTRRMESKKVYSRKRVRLERNDSDQAGLFDFAGIKALLLPVLVQRGQHENSV